MPTKLHLALEPEKGRLAPGMIPDSAAEKLSLFLLASGSVSGLVGLPPSIMISNGFQKVLEAEWNIEKAGGFSESTAMYRMAWSSDMPAAAFSALWNELSGKTLKNRMIWAEDINAHMMRLAQTPLPSDGATVTFRDSSGPWFFYRALVNFLYALMKSLVGSGVSARKAYSLVLHPGLTSAQSVSLNEAIVDVAAADWMKMGFAGLFSTSDRIEIEQAKLHQEARVKQDWEGYRAKQEALNREVADLEDFEKWVERAKTPFDALRKGMGSLGDILDILGKVPGIVWVGAAATAGYFFVVKPAKRFLIG